MMTALGNATTVGYVWTGEIVGYSIKYAYRTTTADGRERILLAVDRRLGTADAAAWKLTGNTPATDYKYSVIELRLDDKGGEGKASLDAKITVDAQAKTLALEGYDAATPILKNIKRVTP